jgi:drug/metabolite transporter (DMT)-like permease
MLYRLKLAAGQVYRLRSLNRDRLIFIAAFFAIYIIWGSTYLGIKIAIKTIPPFLMASSRYLIAGLLMLAAAWYAGATRPTLKNIKENAILGFFLLLMGNGGVVFASAYLPSGIIALTIAIEPIWVVLLVFLSRQGNAPGPATIAGILLGFAGTFLLISPGGTNFSMDSFPGFAALFFSTLSWAIGSLYAVRANRQTPALVASGLQMLAGCAFMFVTGLLKGEFSEIHPENFSTDSLLAFIYLIVFGSVVGYSAYAYLLKNASPDQVATHAYVNPLVAVLLGTFIGNEEFTGKIGIAALLLLSGVILVMRKKT